MGVKFRRINFILTIMNDCGLRYTLSETLIRFGFLRRYPIHQVQYSNWEKTDKVKRIIENVVNYDKFVSPNGDLVVFSDEVIMCLRNGIQIYVRPQQFFNSDLHVIYETMLRQDYGTVLPGQTVIDIGAFIGDFTIFAASAGATVYAFEPSLKSYEQLLKNVKLMNLNSVKAFNVAVVPHKYANRRVVLSCEDGNLGSTHIVSVSDCKSDVKCISLKEFFMNSEIKKCDLLKLDCEGSEYKILADLESEVYSKIKRIVLEFHNGCPKRLENLRRKLESEGFFVETVIFPYSRVQGLLRCWK